MEEEAVATVVGAVVVVVVDGRRIQSYEFCSYGCWQTMVK